MRHNEKAPSERSELGAIYWFDALPQRDALEVKPRVIHQACWSAQRDKTPFLGPVICLGIFSSFLLIYSYIYVLYRHF